MSMSIVHHVREKSQAKGSARTLLLNLAIYANDCCGVAWPSDATLRRETNVSHQRIHELKNLLEEAGELVIVERPGFSNLYCVAWQGKPVGGTCPETGRHDPCCPLRYGHPSAREEGSEIPDPPGQEGVSEPSDPQVSEIPDPPPQRFLSRKRYTTREENEAPVARAPDEDKVEARSPFWCAACGYATPTCRHRVIHAPPPARPRAHPSPPRRRL
jgi:hypothetical protein